MKKWLVSFCLSFLLISCLSFSVNAETSKRDQLLELKRLASQGEILGCPFSIGTNKETVIDKWGKPENIFSEFIYEYKKRLTYFVFDGDKIFSIERFSVIKGLTISDVIDTLGEPTTYDKKFGLLTYDMGKYELDFHAKNSTTDRISHARVFLMEEN